MYALVTSSMECAHISSTSESLLSSCQTTCDARDKSLAHTGKGEGFPTQRTGMNLLLLGSLPLNEVERLS